MNLLTTKIVTMSILGLVSLLVGFIPMIVAKKVNLAHGSRGGLVVSCLSCFGGGVILTTALTHMLPEVNLFLQYNIDHGQLSNTGLPLAEIWVLCGFFMIYFIEELTHVFMARCNPEKKEENTKEETSKMLNGHGSGHGHSHDIPEGLTKEGGFEAALRGFLVVLAISLHAIFEGIAMGLTNNTRSVWLLFIAISAHKYVISFCISMQFVTSGLKPLLSIIYFSTFALISPVGAGIGILLSETVKSEAETQTVVVTVLQGLATGTLLYVVFFEVIEKERQKGTSGMIQVSFIILGFLCMLVLESVELQLAPLPVPEEVNSCSIEPSFLKNLVLPVNVSCVKGVLSVV